MYQGPDSSDDSDTGREITGFDGITFLPDIGYLLNGASAQVLYCVVSYTRQYTYLLMTDDP